MRSPRYLRLLTALLWLICFSAIADESIDFTRIDPKDHASHDWYLDSIDGRNVGYWHASLAVNEETLVSTFEQVRYETHGGEQLKTRDHIQWTESRDYKPRIITVQKESGSLTITQTYRFTDDGIELTSEQDGRSISRKLPPIQGRYLTAAQQAIATEVYLKRGENSFEMATLDPLVSLTPYITRYERSDKPVERVQLQEGQLVDATPWKVSYSILPGFAMRLWVDEQSQQIGLAYDIGGMTLTSKLSDESVTNAEFDPPEMAGLSVVVPDRPIENMRRQRRIVYELSYEAGDAPIVPISAGNQKVDRLGDGLVRITVDLDAKPDETMLAADRPTQAQLAASIMIDHEDKTVQMLAKQAVSKLASGATKEQIANACKRAVSRHLTGASLAIGDASASETARTGKGDCTESSVLLAALLRAHGIPSRCVSGLVYSEEPFAGQSNVFVYHQWTQAWIASNDEQGRWVDLDAAMWRYSAGHIALGVSNMGDDDQEQFIKLVPMMQDLKIKVIGIAPGPEQPNADDQAGVEAQPEFDG